MTSRRSNAPTLRLREPADVLAAIPYMVGYHPSDSVVVLAMRTKQLVFAARDDLPISPADARANGEELVQIMRRERATGVIVVGYGEDERVRPAVLGIRDACAEAGLCVLEVLRVCEGRYWSYLCQDPGCCPADGSPFDPTTSAVAAQWTVAGRVALPDRAAYEEQLMPVGGPTRISMAKATARAGDRLFDLVTQPIDERELTRKLLDAAHDVLHKAVVSGEPLTDDEVAWLTVLLSSQPVRNAAWAHVSTVPQGDDELTALRNMWLDVMRRAEADLRAAPAALFAYAAWRGGDSHLARVAVDRALLIEPTYDHALRLHDALNRCLPPGVIKDGPSRRRQPRRGARPRRRSSSGRARSRRG